MRRYALWMTFFGWCFLGGMMNTVLAVDMYGPYDNQQTAVEYTTLPDLSQPLIALSSQHRPSEQVGAEAISLYSLWNPGADRWENQRLADETGHSVGLWMYPLILGRNQHDDGDDNWVMDTWTHGTGQLAWLKKPVTPAEWALNAAFNDGDMRPTQVSVSRVDPERQWLAGEWLFHDFLQRIRTTPDGWETFDAPDGDGLPQVNGVGWGIYSLAMDDRAEPTQGLAVVGPDNDLGELDSGDNAGGALVGCDGLWQTLDAGDTWVPVTVAGWNPATMNLQNLHVAMIPADVTDPDGSYLVYLVGLDMTTPATPHIFCNWATWLPNNTWVWHDPAAQIGIESGTAALPTYPFDLIVEWDPSTELYNLLLTTSGRIFFAGHNGTTEAIPWAARMGNPGSLIYTRNFRKIAVDPVARYKFWVVAGKECCWRTEDAGQTWMPMYNSGRMVQYPSGGACEGAGTYPQMAFYAGDPVTPNSDYCPMLVQYSGHWNGMPPYPRYDKTRTIGMTYASTRSYNRIAVSRVDNEYYAAFVDPFSNTGNPGSKGIVYTSANSGATWVPNNWTTLFGTNQENAPQVSQIVPDPNVANKAYITFRNTTNLAPAIPPLMYTDNGGQLWQTPLTNLPVDYQGDRHLAVAQDMTGNRWYLTSGTQLWTTTSLTTPWTQRTLPAAFANEGLVAVIGHPGHPLWVGIASNNHFAYSNNGGVTWSTVRTFPAGTSCQSLVGRVEIVGISPPAMFASCLNADWQPVLYRSFNLGQTWQRLETWADPNGAWQANATLLTYMNPVGTNRHRILWSSVENMNTANVPSPASVKLYDWPLMPVDIPQSMTLTAAESPYYMAGTTTVGANATLTIEPGVRVYVAAKCSLLVKGTLAAGASAGLVEFVRLDSNGTADRWSGIYVTGAASLNHCEVSGADTGLVCFKATGTLSLSASTFHDNGVGVFVYDNPGAVSQKVQSCLIRDNDKDGLSLLSAKNFTLELTKVRDNGCHGVVLTSSAATLSENIIVSNGNDITHIGYGLKCYASSPILYCNTFQNNAQGEIGLVNGSNAVLWNAGGTAGANRLENGSRSLIQMWDSNPVIDNGGNDFIVDNSTDVYMEDLSGKAKLHYVRGNYYSFTPSVSNFRPASVLYWVWNPTSGQSGCGEPQTATMSEDQSLLQQGLAAENGNDPTGAVTRYAKLLTTYGDAPTVAATASRLFDAQQIAGTGYETLLSLLPTVAADHTDDPALVGTVTALLNRARVESGDYTAALASYANDMATADSKVDSLYAAIDYAIAELRMSLDHGHGALDAARPTAGVASIHALLEQLDSALPASAGNPTQSSVGPGDYRLMGNYPNPFNPTTTISYYLPRASQVRIEVFNLMGQWVATLQEGPVTAGLHTVPWNAANMASGLYLCRMDAEGHVATLKMLLMK